MTKEPVAWSLSFTDERNSLRSRRAKGGKKIVLQNLIFQCPKKKSLWSTLTKTQSRNYTGKKQITGMEKNKQKTSNCGRPVVDWMSLIFCFVTLHRATDRYVLLGRPLERHWSRSWACPSLLYTFIRSKSTTTGSHPHPSTVGGHSLSLSSSPLI